MTGLLCKNPRIVLILGTGYLGKALAESLRKAGHTALTADIDPQKPFTKQTLQTRPPCRGWPPASPPPRSSSCAPARGEAERKPTATFTLMERGTRWKPFPERRSSSVPAQPSMESRTDAGLRRNTTFIPPLEKRAAYSGGTGGFGSGGHGRPAGSPVRAGPLCSRLPVRHEGEGPPRSHEQMAQLHPPG